MKQSIRILLALACALAYLSVVQAQCCRASLTMTYIDRDHNCESTGGTDDYNFCRITVCADGKRLVGFYCGRGSCDIFGCDCDGGCIPGKWKESFLDNHPDHRIIVIEEHWCQS